MADIEYIHNVVTSVHLDGSAAPVWEQAVVGMPDMNPDECVIRSITFNNAAVADTSVLMIWSNMKNDFIGSIASGAITTSAPGTRIRLHAPVPSRLLFRVYVPDANGAPPVHVDVTMKGDFVIHMDFIKYKRVAPHAKVNFLK